MAVNEQAYREIINELSLQAVNLVAVSKTKPIEDILQLYSLGQRDFGENYVQEMEGKANQLPKDIRWHFIGHLQTNKVKYIAPFVHLIHAVDTLKLLKEINKQAVKNNRSIDCLLQVHIAREETKFGFSAAELEDLYQKNRTELQELKNIKIKGLMGMASLTDDWSRVRNEFNFLKTIFDQLSGYPVANSQLSILSMGMTSDYKIALEEGSTMIRIGSLIFGEREKMA